MTVKGRQPCFSRYSIDGRTQGVKRAFAAVRFWLSAGVLGDN